MTPRTKPKPRTVRRKPPTKAALARYRRDLSKYIGKPIRP